MATKKETEKQLQQAVKALLKTLGIPYYLNVQGPVWGNVRGRPDMEAIKDGVTYYLELKQFRQGRMSEYQRRERARIEAAGAPYVVVRSVEDVVQAMDLPVLLRNTWMEK